MVIIRGFVADGRKPGRGSEVFVKFPGECGTWDPGRQSLEGDHGGLDREVEAPGKRRKSCGIYRVRHALMEAHAAAAA